MKGSRLSSFHNIAKSRVFRKHMATPTAAIDGTSPSGQYGADGPHCDKSLFFVQFLGSPVIKISKRLVVIHYAEYAEYSLDCEKSL